MHKIAQIGKKMQKRSTLIIYGKSASKKQITRCRNNMERNATSTCVNKVAGDTIH